MTTKSKKILSKSKETLPECAICVEPFTKKQEFHCISCQFTCCTSCIKQYLLTSSQDPHCMNCKNVIPYENFMKMTEKSWRLKTYKTHRENILWEREQSQLPATIQHLQKRHEYNKLEKQIKDLCKIINECTDKIRELKFQQQVIWNRQESTTQNTDEQKSTFSWTYKCPTEDCRGFLNKDFECVLCSHSFCEHCLIQVDGDEAYVFHECDPALVETLKEIQKTSKPCPTCGQVISKISGCDQMFCTDCGTAFSWKTGEKETGVIHNPHAFHYFQNHPEERTAYEEMMRNRNENECRGPTPSYRHMHDPEFGKIQHVRDYTHRIFNELQFHLPNLENYLRNRTSNQDIRIRYLEQNLDEKNFKKILHTREKKRNYLEQIYPILLSTYQVFGGYLWGIIDNIQNMDTVHEILEQLNRLRAETNQILEDLCLEFGYKTNIYINYDLEVLHLSIPQN
jgi:archaellum component FlaC